MKINYILLLFTVDPKLFLSIYKVKKKKIDNA